VTEMAGPNRISRVILRNYKSIRQCDVSLGSITFLVGPNGAGKSNFVEALRFLCELSAKVRT
jgi:predicted ATPase